MQRFYGISNSGYKSGQAAGHTPVDGEVIATIGSSLSWTIHGRRRDRLIAYRINGQRRCSDNGNGEGQVELRRCTSLWRMIRCGRVGGMDSSRIPMFFRHRRDDHRSWGVVAKARTIRSRRFFWGLVFIPSRPKSLLRLCWRMPWRIRKMIQMSRCDWSNCFPNRLEMLDHPK